jgi:hypothetical protein
VLLDPEGQRKRIDSIGSRAIRHGGGKVQATMSAIRRNLDALGKEAKSQRRESLGPSFNACNVDILDAPTCSLQYLEDSARGARDAIIGGSVVCSP